MAKETFVTAEDEVKTIMPQVTRLYNSLDEFRVTSESTFLEAAEKVKIAKEKLKEIKSVKKVKFMDHINALRDNTIALFDTPINRLEEIIAKLDKKMVDWRNEQLEKERLAKEKAEVEAREKERLEKERLRKEAEEKEAEAKRAEEAAKKAEKNGDHKKAQEKIEEAQEKKEEAKEIKKEVKEVVVEAKEVKTKTKANGLHFRKYWKGEIIDENKLPREFLMPNVTAINEYIEKNKESAKIPGVRIYSEERSVA